MSAWTETLDENASDAQGQMAEACKHCGRPHGAHYRNGKGAWIDCRKPSTITPELLAILIDDLNDIAADLKETGKSPALVLGDRFMVENVAARARAWAERLTK